MSHWYFSKWNAKSIANLWNGLFYGWSFGCHTLCDILENSCEGNCHEITYKIISFCNAIEVDTNWCGLIVFWSKLVIFSLHKLFNKRKQRGKLINGLLKNRCLAGSDKGFWLAWIPRFFVNLLSCFWVPLVCPLNMTNWQSYCQEAEYMALKADQVLHCLYN